MSRQKKRIKSQKRPTEIIKKVNNKKTKSRKKGKERSFNYKCDFRMRNLRKRGYDIIRNKFFVETDGINESIKWFDNFEAYEDYVNHAIYDNACYYQCDYSKIETNADYEKLNERKFFVEDTIDDCAILPKKEILRYNEGEKIKEQCKSWIDKFNSCSTIDEFRKIERDYIHSLFSFELKFLGMRQNVEQVGIEKSTDLIDQSWQSTKHYINFFLWHYISSAINDKKRFDILMEYMSSYTCATSLVREICTVFNPDDVMAAYNFTDSSERGIYNQKKRLKDIVLAIKNGFIDKSVYAFFDNVSHYYCEKCTYTLLEEKTRRSEGLDRFSTYRYFETFEEFIEYRNGDLSNCDLTNAIKLYYDFSNCKTDASTKLPPRSIRNSKYVVKKKYSNDKFEVFQEWYDFDGRLVKQNIRSFDYFFDFVAFMKGDLSNADLLSCVGLINLNDISEISFKNAKVTSAFCEKFGISYEPFKIDNNKLGTFSLTEQFEKSTELVRETNRELIDINGLFGEAETKERIYYVSDIHLLHKLECFRARSKADAEYVLRAIAINIVEESKSLFEDTENTILIGGDVSSDFAVFEMFIEILRDELDRRKRDPLVVFVLGNHELWDFSRNTFDEIVARYNDLIAECGMYLLQNNIIYKDSENVIHKISTEEILSLEKGVLREKLKTSRMIFFGGLAFSGYDEEFNANMGIYRETIDRDIEIEESKKFEDLYKKVCSFFPDKNLIVFTHMPVNCWTKNENYHKNFIYVSGHTHNNYFCEEGDKRVYADNQIGYGNKKTHMKWFDIENEYDYFADYPDGIHPIIGEMYEEFYRGKNISMNFNREENILCMLKKNGYYCFIHKTKDGSFTILNGGERKKLDIKDFNYYYENMDSIIATIKRFLDSIYTDLQESISAEIRKIGGLGKIHGCIIDIDRFNHVYVNPLDGKITGYWAQNMIEKEVYPTVAALLKEECPFMYEKYVKLLKQNSKNLPALQKSENDESALLPQSYHDTDIYKISREICKMQKLNFNILAVWYDVDDMKKLIELN